MKPDIQKLMSIGLKVRTPLSLAGLLIIVLYAIYKDILSLNVFDKVGSNATFLILQNILDKLFWLAFVALILGVISYLTTIILNQRNKLASSKVSLIDASLDPNDSPYEQTIEQGRKKIQYKGQKEASKNQQKG